MAVDKGHALLKKIEDAYLNTLKTYVFSNQENAFGKWANRQLSRLLNRSIKRSTFWFSPLILKGLCIHPYFIFHYSFNRLYLNDAEFRSVWDQIPYQSAGPAHRLQDYQRRNDTEAALADIQAKQTPVYKLDWRIDLSAQYWKTIMHELHRHLEQYPST